MKPETEDQDELQRMLALRRREQPPQHFFKGLSHAVIDRIQNPEPLPPPTFWQRLGLDFDSKPVLVCVSGVVVCGLLAYGLISSRNVEKPAPNDGSDPVVSRLAVHSTPGQMGAATPVMTPGSKPEEASSSGAAVMVSPAANDRMALRPRLAPLAPLPGK